MMFVERANVHHVYAVTVHSQFGVAYMDITDAQDEQDAAEKACAQVANTVPVSVSVSMKKVHEFAVSGRPAPPETEMAVLVPCVVSRGGESSTVTVAIFAASGKEAVFSVPEHHARDAYGQHIDGVLLHRVHKQEGYVRAELVSFDESTVDVLVPGSAVILKADRKGAVGKAIEE